MFNIIMLGDRVFRINTNTGETWQFYDKEWYLVKEHSRVTA